MGRPHVVWTAAIGSLVVLDVLLDRRHDGSTLSEVTRSVFHTETPAGRCAFVAGWAVLSAWFVPHICRKTAQSLGTLHLGEQQQKTMPPTRARRGSP